ncbi:hypothetical protein Xkoz_00274 [Xenorhabdus kozodoii]|uniref:Uncharacterized protein n=1 Tax=Xenorhabdus kozodoii TaxID=351676 RepID=A0A2D0LHS1_9GAMM|nr:hypothetical protein Xkoz_00274 [Xenorhabdus kozodoii]
MSNNNYKMEASILHNADLSIVQYIIFVITLNFNKPIISLKKVTKRNYMYYIKFNLVTISSICGNNGLTQHYYICIIRMKNHFP